MTKPTHRYIWCPQDEHGDHEIVLEYVIHPGRPASPYGPAPHPAEDDVIEIIGATEGGIALELGKYETEMAVDAIECGVDWDDGQPDEATEWRDYDRDC